MVGDQHEVKLGDAVLYVAFSGDGGRRVAYVEDVIGGGVLRLRVVGPTGNSYVVASYDETGNTLKSWRYLEAVGD